MIVNIQRYRHARLCAFLQQYSCTEKSGNSLGLSRADDFAKGTEMPNKRMIKMMSHGIKAVFGGRQILEKADKERKG